MKLFYRTQWKSTTKLDSVKHSAETTKICFPEVQVLPLQIFFSSSCTYVHIHTPNYKQLLVIIAFFQNYALHFNLIVNSVISIIFVNIFLNVYLNALLYVSTMKWKKKMNLKKSLIRYLIAVCSVCSDWKYWAKALSALPAITGLFFFTVAFAIFVEFPLMK